MSNRTVFERNSEMDKPESRAAWEESFKPVLSDLRSELQPRQPEQIAALSGADWDAAAGEFRLSLFGEPYRIQWPDLVAYPLDAIDPCPPNRQGLFLYYLSMADGVSPAGTWISFRELPDGGFYHQAFQGYSGDVLVQKLGNDVDAFARAAKAAGGQEIEPGDRGYAFQALPQVWLAIVYWMGDEEFSPRAQVLFDAAAGHYLPADGLAGLGAQLVHKLLRGAA